MIDRLTEPRIRISAGQCRGEAEIIECTQNVVAPPIGMHEAQKSLVCRLAGAETAEEVALQEIFFTRSARLSGFGRASGCPLVFQEPLQHVDRAGEGRTDRAIGSLTVPAAVIEAFAYQPANYGRDVDPEIGAVGNGSPVDALFDFALPLGLTAFIPPRVCADQFDSSFCPIR
jgi:hypothetical protein